MSWLKDIYQNVPALTEFDNQKYLQQNKSLPDGEPISLQDTVNGEDQIEKATDHVPEPTPMYNRDV